MFVDAIRSFVWFTKYFHFLFVFWQSCNHFNVIFKVLLTNVTNVIFSLFPQQSWNTLVSFHFFPTKSFNFFWLKPFLAFIAVLKWFSFHLYQICCANVFYIFKSKTRIVFWSKKNRLWTRLTFSDTGTPGWRRLVYSRSFRVLILCTILTKVLPCIDLFGLNIVTLFFLKSLTCILLLKLLHLIIKRCILVGQRSRVDCNFRFCLLIFHTQFFLSFVSFDKLG